MLQDYAARGEPVPPSEIDRLAPESPAQDTAIPEFFTMPLCGTIDATGFVSAKAIENYLGVLQGRVDQFLREHASATGLELVVSCALMPQGKKLIVIETSPANACGGSLYELQAALEQAPAPPVVGGPVALVLYRRTNLAACDRLEIQPFGPYGEQIAANGIEAALMKAAGLELTPAEGEPRRQSWWRKIVRFLTGTRAPAPVTESFKINGAHQEMKDWLFDLECRSATLPTEYLQQYVIDTPDELTFQAALAGRFCELLEWPRAVAQYTVAISLEPQFVPLYSRRAKAAFGVGKSPGSAGRFE